MNLEELTEIKLKDKIKSRFLKKTFLKTENKALFLQYVASVFAQYFWFQ